MRVPYSMGSKCTLRWVSRNRSVKEVVKENVGHSSGRKLRMVVLWKILKPLLKSGALALVKWAVL